MHSQLLNAPLAYTMHIQHVLDTTDAQILCSLPNYVVGHECSFVTLVRLSQSLWPEQEEVGLLSQHLQAWRSSRHPCCPWHIPLPLQSSTLHLPVAMTWHDVHAICEANHPPSTPPHLFHPGAPHLHSLSSCPPAPCS